MRVSNFCESPSRPKDIRPRRKSSYRAKRRTIAKQLYRHNKRLRMPPGAEVKGLAIRKNARRTEYFR